MSRNRRPTRPAFNMKQMYGGWAGAGDLGNLAPWQLPWVDEYWDASFAVTEASERVSLWTPRKGSHDFAQATGANQPILLPYAGTNYLWLPGVSGNYASIAAGIALTNHDIIVYVALNDFGNGATDQTLIDNADGSWLYLSGGGVPRLVLPNGATDIAASATPTLSDFTGYWLRARYVNDSGSGNYLLRFYSSTDAVTTAVGSISWTQIGTDRTGAAITPAVPSGALAVGSVSAGNSALALGKFYRALIYDGPIDSGGTLVFDADFTAVAEGATSFTESSSNAATVTVNSTGAKPAQVVGRPWIMGDQAAYYMDAAFSLPKPTELILALRVNAWGTNDQIFGGINLNTLELYQQTGTPRLTMYAGSDGPSFTQLALNTRGIVDCAFDGASSQMQLGLATAVTGDSGGGGESAGIRLFANAVPAEFGAAQITAIARCSAILTAAQRAQTIRAMAAQCGVPL